MFCLTSFPYFMSIYANLLCKYTNLHNCIQWQKLDSYILFSLLIGKKRGAHAACVSCVRVWCGLAHALPTLPAWAPHFANEQTVSAHRCPKFALNRLPQYNGSLWDWIGSGSLFCHQWSHNYHLLDTNMDYIKCLYSGTVSTKFFNITFIID